MLRLPVEIGFEDKAERCPVGDGDLLRRPVHEERIVDPVGAKLGDRQDKVAAGHGRGAVPGGADIEAEAALRVDAGAAGQEHLSAPAT